MHLFVNCFYVIFAFVFVTQATCMTNREFAESLIQSGEDFEEIYPGNERFDQKEEGALELPGGPDDEFDKESLAMMLASMPDTEASNIESDLGLSYCHCYKGLCHCCRLHVLRIALPNKHYRFHLRACVFVRYVAGTLFNIRFTLQGKTLYHKSISLHSPPRACYRSSVFNRLVLCMGIYDVNLLHKSFCVRFEEHVHLNKKYHILLKLGCFKASSLGEEEMVTLMNDNQALVDHVTGNKGEFTFGNVQSMKDLLQVVEIPDEK